MALITGGVKSSVQVAVRDTDIAGLPHASETVQVLVCEREQPFEDTAASEGVGIPTLQLSVAVAVPKAALI